MIEFTNEELTWLHNLLSQSTISMAAVDAPQVAMIGRSVILKLEAEAKERNGTQAEVQQ